MWVSDLVPPWKNKKVGVYYYGDVRKFKNIDNCGEREDNEACKKHRFFFAEMNESKFEYISSQQSETVTDEIGLQRYPWQWKLRNEDKPIVRH